MKQLVHIHGGEAFDTYDEYWQYLVDKEVDDPQEEQPLKWRDRYEEFLGDEWFVIRPSMPSPRNAKYPEWKLWFEKYLPYLEEDVTLVGHSLGAIFLAKYMAEETLPVRISSLHLVAGPFGWDGGFDLPDSLANIEQQCSRVYLYQSRDDDLVPYGNVEKFKQALPDAELIELHDRGHILQPEFPELMERIRSVT